MGIAQNIQRLKNSLPPEVKLVAVIKNIPLEQVCEAVEAGVISLGENRVQEAAGRYQFLRQKYPTIELQMIGHLQRNKVRQALDIFDIIQSVDSERLALEIGRRAPRPVPILIEVNTSGEKSKSGVEIVQAIELVRTVAQIDNLKIQGLMTIGPLSGEARASFRALRELRDELIRLKLPGVEMRWLSMGMTEDWPTAVEEGANLIRIGRGIFQGG
ncbi:YggS family pyridoxal phosphate enzyme [candidate division WOR-1 bacterium RIFOXYB2_FULL_48_7]|uniref:Pyridoxal phosphate homeostasis protein n=1 Tax=candidate division WOR-1 bacterium RIFOXYB2_FULL_48_7 TaxID=1802583 RepID=A0A1F4TTT1_UNCSA|nr:MAG: YggS family pyridoxal phosphate enzyme [candidate division WOR-1 bacterium RIFOXYB2_FULL_48_7]